MTIVTVQFKCRRCGGTSVEQEQYEHSPPPGSLGVQEMARLVSLHKCHLVWPNMWESEEEAAYRMAIDGIMDCVGYQVVTRDE